MTTISMYTIKTQLKYVYIYQGCQPSHFFAFFSPILPTSRQTFKTPAFLEIVYIFRFYDI